MIVGSGSVPGCAAGKCRIPVLVSCVQTWVLLLGRPGNSLLNRVHVIPNNRPPVASRPAKVFHPLIVVGFSVLLAGLPLDPLGKLSLVALLSIIGSFLTGRLAVTIPKADTIL